MYPVDYDIDEDYVYNESDPEWLEELNELTYDCE